MVLPTPPLSAPTSTNDGRPECCCDFGFNVLHTDARRCNENRVQARHRLQDDRRSSELVSRSLLGAEEPAAPEEDAGPAKLGTPLPGCTFGLSIVPPSAIGTVILLTRLLRSPLTMLPTAPDPAIAPGLTDTWP